MLHADGSVSMHYDIKVGNPNRTGTLSPDCTTTSTSFFDFDIILDHFWRFSQLHPTRASAV